MAKPLHILHIYPISNVRLFSVCYKTFSKKCFFFYILPANHGIPVTVSVRVASLEKQFLSQEPVSSKRYKLACAHIEDSDQPAHPRSLIRVFDG